MWFPAQFLQSKELRSNMNSANKNVLKPKVVDCSVEIETQK